MANVFHSAFNGSSTTTHGVKGHDTATSAMAYVANGTGSGNWRRQVREEAVPTGGVVNATTLTAPVSYTKLNNATQGAFFGSGYGFTVGGAAATYSRITFDRGANLGNINDTIKVFFWYNASLSHNDASSRELYTTFALNGVPLTEWEQYTTAAQNVKVNHSDMGFLTLSEGDYVEIFAKVAAGDINCFNLFFGATGFNAG